MLHSRNHHFNTEASQSSLGPIIKDPRLGNSLNYGQQPSKSKIDISRNKANSIAKNSKTYNPTTFIQNTHRDSIHQHHLPSTCQITQNININLIQSATGLNDSSTMMSQNHAFFPSPPQNIA